jgi:hypothetical protein
MTDVDCIARTNVVAFIIPVHPGDAPIHAAGATGLAIAVTIRLLNVSVANHRMCKKVTAESKQQLLRPTLARQSAPATLVFMLRARHAFVMLFIKTT